MSWKMVMDLEDAMEIPFRLRSTSDVNDLKVSREKMAMRELEAPTDLHRAWEGSSCIGVPAEDRVGVGMGVLEERRERLGPEGGETGERTSSLKKAREERARGGRFSFIELGDW